MNYIELINQFWQTRRSKRITSVQSDLYFYLLQECNARNWENPFEVSNKLICATIGISEPTLIDSRNALMQKGLIEFKAGIKNIASPVYALLGSNKGSNLKNLSRNRVKSLVEPLVETELKGEHIRNKLNKTKTKQNNNSDAGASPPENFDFKKSLLDFGFERNLVEEWLKIRKAKKLVSTETALNDFILEVEKNELEKNELLKFIIVKGWGGFKNNWYVNEKNKENGKTTGNNSGNSRKPNEVNYGSNTDPMEYARGF